MSTRTKHLWISLASILVLVGFVSASALWREEPDTVLEYTAAKVTRGDIVRSVSAVGQVAPLTAVELSSQISGLVTEVHVDFNSSVKRGQLLARIDSSTYDQQLRQRQADLEAARANHALVEINARRLKELNEEGIATQQEYDQIRAQLQQSRSALLASEAAIENVRVDLSRCSITSPIDGTVIFKQIEIGKTVVSSLSAPTLFTISPDLSKMKIIARISEVDIGEVHVGQDATFTIDSIPNRQFRGTLTQIRNPYMPSDQQSQAPKDGIVTFDAAIEVDNSDLVLRPGLTANISVVVERRAAVLQIPNSAFRVAIPNATPLQSNSVSTSSDTATVYRLPGGDGSKQPQAVVIQLGITDSFVTEIVRGLTENDTVVTSVVPATAPPARRGLFGI